MYGLFEIAEFQLSERRVVCAHCQALRWPGEAPSMCCRKGAVRLNRVQEPPELLRALWLGQHELSPLFLSLARNFNNALALSSMQVDVPVHLQHRQTPSVVICGKVYHKLQPLMPQRHENARGAQLYVLDPPSGGDQLTRMQRWCMYLPQQANRVNCARVLDLLFGILRAHNPFIRDFHAVCQLQREAHSAGDTRLRQFRFVLDPEKIPDGQHARCYNTNFTQLTVLTNESPSGSSVIVHYDGNRSEHISDVHRSFDALHFVCLFPFGDDGWHPAIRRIGSQRRVTALEFYAYRIQTRAGEVDMHLATLSHSVAADSLRRSCRWTFRDRGVAMI
eukprot:m.242051 g.242051  ORF g.242051 m.242051 type:complete len:334 (+) comp17132_c0_seq3:808-1809(+)